MNIFTPGATCVKWKHTRGGTTCGRLVACVKRDPCEMRPTNEDLAKDLI